MKYVQQISQFVIAAIINVAIIILNILAIWFASKAREEIASIKRQNIGVNQVGYEFSSPDTQNIPMNQVGFVSGPNIKQDV